MINDKQKVLAMLSQSKEDCEQEFVRVFKISNALYFDTAHLVHKDFTFHKAKVHGKAHVAVRLRQKFKLQMSFYDDYSFTYFSIDDCRYSTIVRKWLFAFSNTNLLMKGLKTVDQVLLDKLSND